MSQPAIHHLHIPPDDDENDTEWIFILMFAEWSCFIVCMKGKERY